MLVLTTSASEAYPLIRQMDDAQYSGFGKARFVTGTLNGEHVCCGILDVSVADQSPTIAHAKASFGSGPVVLLGSCTSLDAKTSIGDLAIGHCVRDQTGTSEVHLDANFER